MDDTTAWSIEAHLEDISNNQLTKREQIAAMCLQGFISNNQAVTEVEVDRFCNVSVLIADKMLKKLEQTNDGH